MLNRFASAQPGLCLQLLAYMPPIAIWSVIQMCAYRWLEGLSLATASGVVAYLAWRVLRQDRLTCDADS